MRPLPKVPSPLRERVGVRVKGSAKSLVGPFPKVPSPLRERVRVRVKWWCEEPGGAAVAGFEMIFADHHVNWRAVRLTARAGLLRGGTSGDPHSRSNGQKGMRRIPRGSRIPDGFRPACVMSWPRLSGSGHPRAVERTSLRTDPTPSWPANRTRRSWNTGFPLESAESASAESGRGR